MGRLNEYQVARSDLRYAALHSGSTALTLYLKMKNLQYANKLKSLTESNRFRFSNSNIHSLLDKEGGIYRITANHDANKTLYIGKAKNIRQRLYSNLLMGQIRSHTLKRKFINAGKCTNQKTAKEYLKKRCSLQYITESDARERTFCGHYFIAILRPQFND